jgi:DNA end-binding protein Ku
MARPIWTGSISFGMVSIPVQLVPAVRRQSLSFNQIDREDQARIRYRKVNDVTGEEVPAERIGRAAQVGKGNYVLIDDEDLAPLAPAKSKQIDLETFVPADEVDPVLFDSSYVLVPDGVAKPYALLASALAGTGRVGVGRFVMRQKEYLAAVRSDGEHLMLSTLVFADEVVAMSAIEGFEHLDEVQIADRELAMAKSLVDAMSDDFDHEQYRDEYRLSVQQLIEEKAAGQEPAYPTPVAPAAKVIDLAAALEASLRAAAESKGRHPSGLAELEPAPTAKRRPAAKKAAAAKAEADDEPAVAPKRARKSA